MFTDSNVKDFYSALLMEFFFYTNRAFLTAEQDGITEKTALLAAFEEIYRRIDLKRGVVRPSTSAKPNFEAVGLRTTMTAVAFGNFLARKGIHFDEIAEDRSCKSA